MAGQVKTDFRSCWESVSRQKEQVGYHSYVLYVVNEIVDCHSDQYSIHHPSLRTQIAATF